MSMFRRPAHPDFRTLAAAVRDSDAKADSGKDIDKIVGEVADFTAAEYVAVQRAQRLAAAGLAPEHQGSALASMWMDGLVAGYRLAQAHERQFRSSDGSHRA